MRGLDLWPPKSQGNVVLTRRMELSQNTDDFARKKSPTGGGIQELWNTRSKVSISSLPLPLEADDKCIKTHRLRDGSKQSDYMYWDSNLGHIGGNLP